MKRGILIASVVILMVFISIIAMNYNKSSKTFTQDGVTYALTLDGARVNTFPSKGMYRVDVTCNNATGKWLYDDWKLAIENINGTNATCDVDFTTIGTTYLNNYIIGLSGTTQGTGQVVDENGYRYEGQHPNNFIWFNNELWRIIGVFDSFSHGQSGQNLVKIIRNTTIGTLSWNSANDATTNDWSKTRLYELLNNYYYNGLDATGSDYCNTGFLSDRYYGKPKCNYTVIGIKSEYRTYIKNVTWYLGGGDLYNDSIDTIYAKERNGNVYSGNSTSTNGYIGLMYASDYGYAADQNRCIRSYNDLSSYTLCSSYDWLYNTGGEWTLHHDPESQSSIARINAYGNMLDNSSMTDGYDVRPTLYLNSSVYVIDGDGSITDPYIIGM